MSLLSYVHFGIQPRIESMLSKIAPGTPVPDGFAAQLKAFRARRERLATFCLFFVITAIILGSAGLWDV
jgi:hypothetical protein